jgi:hypothetical protein
MEYEEFVKTTVEPLICILLTSLVHPYEYRPASLVQGLSAAEAQYVQGTRHVIE